MLTRLFRRTGSAAHAGHFANPGCTNATPLTQPWSQEAVSELQRLMAGGEVPARKLAASKAQKRALHTAAG
jgi:hypothetical protein